MWKKRWLILTLAALVSLAGCQKNVRVGKAATPPLPAPPPAIDVMGRADQSFTGGKYQEAARDYEAYLQLVPSGNMRDQALFRLGVARTLTGNPPDWASATATFKQLMDEFPQSPLKPAAAVILSLYGQVTQFSADSKQRDQKIKQLNTELDKLKQIDAARRKTP